MWKAVWGPNVLATAIHFVPFCQGLLLRKRQCEELETEEPRLRVGSLSWQLYLCCGLQPCVGLESRPAFLWLITSLGDCGRNHY